MKRFTKHPEEWGTFVDVKYWNTIKNPKKYAEKEYAFDYAKKIADKFDNEK